MEATILHFYEPHSKGALKKYSLSEDLVSAWWFFQSFSKKWLNLQKYRHSCVHNPWRQNKKFFLSMTTYQVSKDNKNLGTLSVETFLSSETKISRTCRAKHVLHKWNNRNHVIKGVDFVLAFAFLQLIFHRFLRFISSRQSEKWYFLMPIRKAFYRRWLQPVKTSSGSAAARRTLNLHDV